MRKGETVYKEKHLNRENLTDDDLVQFMVDNPILIERPIVYDDNRAIIGRPPENVLDFSKMNKKDKNINKRQQNKENNRSLIIDAGIKVFLEKALATQQSGILFVKPLLLQEHFIIISNPKKKF